MFGNRTVAEALGKGGEQHQGIGLLHREADRRKKITFDDEVSFPVLERHRYPDLIQRPDIAVHRADADPEPRRQLPGGYIPAGLQGGEDSHKTVDSVHTGGNVGKQNYEMGWKGLSPASLTESFPETDRSTGETGPAS